MVDVIPEATHERGRTASLHCFGFDCRPCKRASDNEDVADGEVAANHVFDDLGIFPAAEEASSSNESAQRSGYHAELEVNVTCSPDEMPEAYSSSKGYGSTGSKSSLRPSPLTTPRTPTRISWLQQPLFGGSDNSHQCGSETSVPGWSQSRYASNATAATSYTSGGEITVEDEYDYYNPITRKKKALSFTDNGHGVFHQRTKSIFGMFERANKRRDTAAPPESPRSADGSPSPSSDDESDRESSGGDIPESPMNLSPMVTPVLRTQKSMFDQENVTNWGILMARLLHRRVHGIAGATMKAVHRRKNSITGTEPNALGSIPPRYILPDVRARAEMVLERTRTLAKVLAQETEDKFDHEWNATAHEEQELVTVMFGKDSADTIMLLANTVLKVIAVQDVLVEARAPCRVFGDIHGQFRDLLLLFRVYEMPGDNMSDFVFNGDFVDRGSHQIAVIGFLFALKILWPTKVWLVRGNHEDRAMNGRYGFLEECKRIFGPVLGMKAFELIQRTFDYLPLGCVVAERVLCVHGGLGNGRWSLHDVREVQRPLREKKLWADPMVWNILWSDPIEDDEADKTSTFGVHESPRGRGAQEIFKFGWNVTKTFCAANGLGLIVRSHQSKAGSLGFSVMHDKMLVRVFSARDYEEHGNDGAMILIKPDENDYNSKRLTVRVQVIGSLTKAKGAPSTIRKKTRKKTSAAKRATF